MRIRSRLLLDLGSGGRDVSHENIAIGLALTGLIFLLFGLILMIWISEGSWRREERHSKKAWALVITASLLFIAATWVGVSG